MPAKQYSETVQKLAFALIQKDTLQYDALRLSLILEHGYDRFRDIQCEAFELLFAGHDEWMSQPENRQNSEKRT